MKELAKAFFSGIAIAAGAMMLVVLAMPPVLRFAAWYFHLWGAS